MNLAQRADLNIFRLFRLTDVFKRHATFSIQTTLSAAWKQLRYGPIPTSTTRKNQGVIQHFQRTLSSVFTNLFRRSCKWSQINRFCFRAALFPAENSHGCRLIHGGPRITGRLNTIRETKRKFQCRSKSCALGPLEAATLGGKTPAPNGNIWTAKIASKIRGARHPQKYRNSSNMTAMMTFQWCCRYKNGHNDMEKFKKITTIEYFYKKKMEPRDDYVCTARSPTHRTKIWITIASAESEG